MQNNLNKPINVDINKTTPVHCENCGGEIFDIVYIYRIIPKLLIAAPADQPLHVPVFRCINCKKLKDIEKILPPKKNEQPG